MKSGSKTEIWQQLQAVFQVFAFSLEQVTTSQIIYHQTKLRDTPV